MFSVIIKGRTITELRNNLEAFLSGMHDFTEPSTPSQEVRQPVASIPDFGPPPAFTPPHIPEQIVTEPTPPAPPIVVPVAAASVNEYGLDSRGLPWDARIHAVTQGVNKDGSWRTRRGIEPAMVAQVEAELRARGSVPMANPVPNFQSPSVQAPTPVTSPFGPPPVMASPPPVEAAPPVAPAAPVSAPVVPPLQQPAPVMPSAPPPPVNLAMHTFETFKANKVMVLAKLVAEGKLVPDYVQTLNKYFGVDQIWNVNDAQLLEMFEEFCKSGLLVKA